MALRVWRMILKLRINICNNRHSFHHLFQVGTFHHCSVPFSEVGTTFHFSIIFLMGNSLYLGYVLNGDSSLICWQLTWLIWCQLELNKYARK